MKMELNLILIRVLENVNNTNMIVSSKSSKQQNLLWEID